MILEKQNKRVLVVDDEQGLRDLLHMTLEAEGYQVMTACDGLEALTLMEKEKFQLVITDIMMPNMDGIKLLEEIKKKDGQIEVIVVTGYGHIETVEHALKKGAYECILKPYSIDKIIKAVEKALEKKTGT